MNAWVRRHPRVFLLGRKAWFDSSHGLTSSLQDLWCSPGVSASLAGVCFKERLKSVSGCPPTPFIPSFPPRLSLLCICFSRALLSLLTPRTRFPHLLLSSLQETKWSAESSRTEAHWGARGPEQIQFFVRGTEVGLLNLSPLHWLLLTRAAAGETRLFISLYF